MSTQHPHPLESSLFGRLLGYLFHLLYYPLAWSYDLVAWLVSLGHWKAWVLSTLPYLPGPHVLEIGHGPGHLQVALHRRGTVSFGLDLSPPMGRQAAHRLRRAGFSPRLLRARSQHLPFPSNSFDQLVSTFPSEYIFDPATLSEAHRLLKPGGCYVILPTAWLNVLQPLRAPVVRLLRLPKGTIPEDTLFAQALRQAGFDVQEHRIPVGSSTALLLLARKPA